MTGNLQPLDQQFQIAKPDGRPTEYFIKWAQQRQIDIGQGITAEQAVEIIAQFMADHPLLEGSGIQLSPSGNIAEDVTISADVQAILDQITSTRGSVLYRGAALWEALAPGTAGYFLKTNGAGADPSWAAGGGGGGGSHPWWWAPPAAADFTMNISGNANNVTKTDDVDAGLIVKTGGANAGMQGCVKALPPAGDWTVEAHFYGDSIPANYIGMLLTLFDSTSNRCSSIGPLFDGVFQIDPIDTNLGGFAGRGTRVVWYIEDLFVKIEYVAAGPTYNFYYSNSGKIWYLLRSTSKTAWMTGGADFIGIAMAFNEGGVVCDRWVQSF